MTITHLRECIRGVGVNAKASRTTLRPLLTKHLVDVSGLDYVKSRKYGYLNALVSTEVYAQYQTLGASAHRDTQ